MKTKEIIVTESNIDLINPDDGFIIYGALFKGDHQGGLLGDGKTLERVTSSGIKGAAYTNQEFLEALNLPLFVYEEYVKTHSTTTRG